MLSQQKFSAKDASFVAQSFNKNTAMVRDLGNGVVRKYSVIGAENNIPEVYQNSSTAVNAMTQIGFYEKLLTDLIMPKKIPFAKSHTLTMQGVLANVTDTDIGIEDIIKPYRGLSVDDTMEKATAVLVDFANFNIEPQHPHRRNAMDNRNETVKFNTSSRASAPVISYAFPYTFNVHENKVKTLHPILGEVQSTAMELQKTLEVFELQYQYDVFSSQHSLYEGYTLLDQKGESAITGLGIPNNALGLADPTLTANQFQQIVLKIREIITNINMSVEGGSGINTFVIPSKNAAVLKTTPFKLADEQLNNDRTEYDSRLAYLVVQLQRTGVPIKVISSNQLNPNTQSAILDPVLESTLNPKQPVPRGNQNSTPLYLLLNDNSGVDQTTIFAPKIRVQTTDFRPADPLGQNMIMGIYEVCTGVNFARPELTRRLITVG